MAKYVYLKSEIPTNTPWIVTLLDRKTPVEKTDYTTKQPTGEMQYPYVIRTEDGREMMHYASETQESSLRLLNIGEKVQVVRAEVMKNGERRTYWEWTTTDGAEARSAATPQLKSNTFESRTAPKQQKDYEQEKLAHDWKLGLAGLLQAHIIAGASKDDARRFAIEDATWVREAADRLASGKNEQGVPTLTTKLDPWDEPHHSQDGI